MKNLLLLTILGAVFTFAISQSVRPSEFLAFDEDSEFDLSDGSDSSNDFETKPEKPFLIPPSPHEKDGSFPPPPPPGGRPPFGKPPGHGHHKFRGPHHDKEGPDSESEKPFGPHRHHPKFGKHHKSEDSEEFGPENDRERHHRPPHHGHGRRHGGHRDGRGPHKDHGPKGFSHEGQEERRPHRHHKPQISNEELTNVVNEFDREEKVAKNLTPVEKL